MRYLPLTDADRQEMLSVIGAPSVDDLFVDVPAEARLPGKIAGLPDHASELAVERHMAALARKNLSAGEAPFFLGAGAYRHHVPASVDHLIQRGEFLTAYTPYQPEIAQGTLQVLFEFQTQVARLLGCDVANASMYDGSTACWEAIGMARRITRRGKAVLSSGLHPHYVSVANTMAKFTGDALVHEAPALDAATDIDALIAAIDKDTSCVVVQYPDILGRIADLTPLADAAHAAGALLVAVVTEPVALGAIRAPGHMGADIVVGEGQSIGVGLQFGGPYLGLFACKQQYVRQMPGRLCGQTVDAAGKRGFVLTLSTREQHIRREKATSNICTNQALVALMTTIFLTVYGKQGMKELAEQNLAKAHYAQTALGANAKVLFEGAPRFHEFVLDLPQSAEETNAALLDKKIIGGLPLQRWYPELGPNASLWCATELTTRQQIDAAAKEIA